MAKLVPRMPNLFRRNVLHRFRAFLAILSIIAMLFGNVATASADTTQYRGNYQTLPPPDRWAQMSDNDLFRMLITLLLSRMMSGQSGVMGGGPAVAPPPNPFVLGQGPLAGLVPNATDAPVTDRNGVCRDNAFMAGKTGLQVVDVRSVGYVGIDAFADVCNWDSTGNTAAPKTIKCEDVELRCTFRFTNGKVQVFKGEAGLSKSDITSYSLRWLPRYPKTSPFRNECWLLNFEQQYGDTRNPAYPTEPGNFDCAAHSSYMPGQPVSMVAPSDRSVVECTNPEPGAWVCKAPRQVTISHPGGSVAIDVWRSYAPPKGCTGTAVDASTLRIACTEAARIFADNWTVRDSTAPPAAPAKP